MRWLALVAPALLLAGCAMQPGTMSLQVPSLTPQRSPPGVVDALATGNARARDVPNGAVSADDRLELHANVSRGDPFALMVGGHDPRTAPEGGWCAAFTAGNGAGRAASPRAPSP
jgi:hypothetical protein